MIKKFKIRSEINFKQRMLLYIFTLNSRSGSPPMRNLVVTWVSLPLTLPALDIECDKEMFFITIF